MATIIKIPGPALCGFADLFEEPRGALVGRVVDTRRQGGAGAPVGRGVVTVTKGKTSTALVPAAGARHGLAILQAAAQAVTRGIDRSASTGQRAAEIAAKLKQSAGAYAAEAKAGKHAPVRIHGDVYVGARLVRPAPATAHQKAAVAKHAKATQRHAAVVAQVRQAVPRVEAAGQAASKFAGAARKAAPSTIHAGVFRTGVFGDDEDKGGTAPTDTGAGAPVWDRATGVVKDSSGAVLYPGYEAAGDFPPGFSGAATVATYTDKDGRLYIPDGVTPAPGGVLTFDPTAVPGTVEIPARGGTLSPEDAKQVHRTVPAGAVTAPSPQIEMSKGSAEYWYGPQTGAGDGGQYGMIWSGRWNPFAENRGTRWIRRGGQNLTGGDNWWDAATPPGWPNGKWTDATAHLESMAHEGYSGGTYGPLIGRPGSEFAGLQYAIDEDKWFWQAQNVPAAVAKPLDDAAAAKNKAAVDTARKAAQGLVQIAIDGIKKTAVANAAAVYGAALQAAKDAAEQAEAVAKAEAEDALAQQRAEAEQARAATAAETADITARQQEEAEARRQALEQARADAAAAAEERRLELEERRAQMEAEREAARSAPAPSAYEEPAYAPPRGAPPAYAPPPPEPSPEDDAAWEADEIEESVEGIIGSDGEPPVDGAGNVIGIDQWGNAVD